MGNNDSRFFDKTYEGREVTDTELMPELDKSASDLKYYAKRKLVVDWDDEDSRALAYIRNKAQEVYLEIFGDTLGQIDAIDFDNIGVVTTKDLESKILMLSEQKIQIDLQVNSVKLDALFAKYSLDDDYHESYQKCSGTNNLREAYAHTETVEKRYAYFFRYYIHTMCDGLSRDIDSLIKNLSSVLFRRGSHG